MLLNSMITIKSKSDVAILREGGHRHAEILKKLAEMVKPGLKSSELEDAARKLIAEGGLTNQRIVQHDAVEVLRDMILPGVLSGVHIFFPDPWPKARQQKRRLIQAPLVALLKENNVAAEINFHTNEPPLEFVKLCLESGVKLTFGSDAHNLYEVGEFYPHLKLLEAAGFNGSFEDILLKPFPKAGKLEARS